jgi:myosin heavy subunit
MNRSLIQWISLTCHDHLHITSQTLLDHSSTENEFIANLIIVLGQHLLPNEHIKTPNDMLHIFTKFFRINGEYDQINEENQMVLMLKLLLKFVVSPHCGERESFVAYILSLTPEIQEDLMEALQSGDLEDINVEEEQEEIAEAEDSPQKKEKSSFPSSTWSHENESYCDLCPQLKQELEKCHKEISSFVQRERLQQESHRTENSLQMHKIMDLESLVTEKTSLLNQITSEFNQLKKKELEIAQEVKEKSAMAMKISELQDQVDSLIQMSKRADVAEKQVEKLREKLDRLDGVSEQLKAETTAHNETHVTLLQYEQELNTLRTAKQHLEEYRKRCVENEIQINDLKIQLKKSEGSNESLLSQLKELMDGNELSSNHAKILTKELLNASEEIRNHERGLGVGKHSLLHLTSLPLTVGRVRDQ